MSVAALNKLSNLPGMADVKKQVEEIITFKKVAAMRERKGLKVKPQSHHMVFTGNPGTGKTTAARLIGEAFAEIGILKTEEESELPFVEIHHADITHPHVGESERRIKKIFKGARGGVIFIDEAYAFVDGTSSHKSDDKVITAILQLMEDLREEILVIVAGYPDKMNEFLDSNPGLRSRFSNSVHFADYEVPELVMIAQSMLVEADYRADDAYWKAFANRMWYEKDDKGFGNGRSVRNVIEQSIRSQSVRISRLENPSRHDLETLTVYDLDDKNKPLLTEKETLTKAMKRIQLRLLDIELREAAESMQR